MNGGAIWGGEEVTDMGFEALIGNDVRKKMPNGTQRDIGAGNSVEHGAQNSAVVDNPQPGAATSHPGAVIHASGGFLINNHAGHGDEFHGDDKPLDFPAPEAKKKHEENVVNSWEGKPVSSWGTCDDARGDSTPASHALDRSSVRITGNLDKNIHGLSRGEKDGQKDQINDGGEGVDGVGDGENGGSGEIGGGGDNVIRRREGSRESGCIYNENLRNAGIEMNHQFMDKGKMNSHHDWNADGLAAGLDTALWSGTNKNRDVSTRTLACLFARSLALLVRLLRTACFARALRCAHSFARSLTSLNPSLVGK